MTLAWGAKVRGRLRQPGPIFFQAAEGQGGFFAPWPVERRFLFRRNGDAFAGTERHENGEPALHYSVPVPFG